MIGPDGERFPWGNIYNTIAIDDGDDHIAIVKYLPKVNGAFQDRLQYHPYYNGKDMYESFYTLDAALVAVFSLKRTGKNHSPAVFYACKILDIPVDV